MIPATMSRAEEAEWVTRMLARLERRTKRVKRSDEDLMRRAQHLNDELFEGRAVPGSVSWVSNQNSRWGSCTPSDRSIRLSHRLQSMPTWVQDYVLVHELAHLLVSGHDADFWALVERYPQTERAKGFLSGWAAAQASPELPVDDG